MFELGQEVVFGDGDGDGLEHQLDFEYELTDRWLCKVRKEIYHQDQ